jgi:hypothetical protein
VSQYGEEPNLTWLKILEDLTPENYRHGFEQLKYRDNSFPPNPAEFRALCEINNAWERQAHKIIQTDNMIENKTAKEKRASEGLEQLRKLRQEQGI